MAIKSKNNTKDKMRTIPEFANQEEEAAFWDTHDFTEFWDELEPVKVKFAKNLSKGITVRFDEDTLNKLRRDARAMGMGPTTYVRMLVLEKLRSK
jgi:predicted DNA binding CopG/RHH family protein